MDLEEEEYKKEHKKVKLFISVYDLNQLRQIEANLWLKQTSKA